MVKNPLTGMMERIGDAFDVCAEVDDELLEWFNRQQDCVIKQEVPQNGFVEQDKGSVEEKERA